MSKIIFSVTELNQATQKVLEDHFNPIWVEGEISNISRPSSGHLYFSLKDAKAQVRCAMFRMYSQKLTFEPRLGLLVQVKAKVSIYPDRGDYQLIVESMEMAGDGLLRQAYEQLLKKLSSLGLFEERHKKKIPRFPTHVGIITSPTGAAIRDILTVLNRRFPALSVSIYPTSVQGASAAPEIVKAIRCANRHAQCDVLIVSRGGGSLEDLWPFNEEIVAQAIFESNIPIVTGIGHEIDFTIADFVGDCRAATPSAAAELVSPNYIEVNQQLLMIEKRLKMDILQRLNYRAQRLDGVIKRLRHPRESIQALLKRLTLANNRLLLALKRNIQDKHRLLASSARALESISPLATLGRGYVIALHEKTKEIVRSCSKVNLNDVLCLKLSDGEIRCQTLSTTPSPKQERVEEDSAVI
jgi:exodeoxyribonuclease VII large subunit